MQGLEMAILCIIEHFQAANPVNDFIATLEKS